MRNFLKAAFGIATFSAIFCCSALADESPTLRVNVFPGAQNLPLYTGLAKGIFERHGFKIDLQFTPNSDDQRNGLAERKFEIAHAAVDNAVAMVEGAGHNVIIVLGGDSSMNEFFVQPGINSIADLRGKEVLVIPPGIGGTLGPYVALGLGLLLVLWTIRRYMNKPPTLAGAGAGASDPGDARGELAGAGSQDGA